MKVATLALATSATMTLCPLAAAPAGAQETALAPALAPLEFLVGRWETVSVTAAGDSLPGSLEYRPVLGGGWIRVAFYGRPPDGRLWEAHGLIGPDSAGGFVSHVFYDAASPHVGRGEILEENAVRFTTVRGTSVTGIDYHDRGDGTVYQENWALGEDGARRVTLRTVYTAAP